MINIFTINAIVIGHVLTYLAIFLNFHDGQQFMHGGKIGIIFGVIAMTSSYFSQSFIACGTRIPPLVMTIIHWTSVVSVALSYIIWLTY